MTDPSWHTDDHPELRARPPWVMADMVALEPELAEQMLSGPSPAAGAIAAQAQAEMGRGVGSHMRTASKACIVEREAGLRWTAGPARAPRRRAIAPGPAR